MENKIKIELTAADLALYLGCECVYEPEPGGDTEHGTLVLVLANIDRVTIVTENHKNRVTARALYFKPILRPLSDMTEEEYMEVQYRVDKAGIGYDAQQGAEITRYLLSKHFDLFGWIDSGLAIDKTVGK